MAFRINKTALVTGASAGIGLAFAREFAGQGFDLVLVARREQKLKDLADELEQHHGIKAIPLAIDLAEKDAIECIITRLTEHALHNDVLVNNAGFTINEEFLALDWPSHQRCLEVMQVILRMRISAHSGARTQSKQNGIAKGTLVAVMRNRNNNMMSPIIRGWRICHSR